MKTVEQILLYVETMRKVFNIYGYENIDSELAMNLVEDFIRGTEDEKIKSNNMPEIFTEEIINELVRSNP